MLTILTGVALKWPNRNTRMSLDIESPKIHLKRHVKEVFTNQDFDGHVFHSCKFNGRTLKNCTLYNCDLNNVKIENSNFQGHIEDSEIYNANIYNSVIKNTKIDNSILTGNKVIEKCNVNRSEVY